MCCHARIQKRTNGTFHLVCRGFRKGYWSEWEEGLADSMPALIRAQERRRVTVCVPREQLLLFAKRYPQVSFGTRATWEKDGEYIANQEVSEKWATEKPMDVAENAFAGK